MTRARIGNLLLITALAALAVALGCWQREAWWTGRPDAERLLWAGMLVLAWLTVVFIFLRCLLYTSRCV